MYYEAIDLIVNCIKDRFYQPGYKINRQLKSILLKACKADDYEDDLHELCKFYKDDFDMMVLQTQHETLSVHYRQENPMDATTHITIFDIKKYMLSLSPAQLSLMYAVKRLLQLILVMPATNVSSERSFSALRRVKSYLRATMKQDRLNHLMLIHVHKDKADELDFKQLINEFIHSEHRLNIFAPLD